MAYVSVQKRRISCTRIWLCTLHSHRTETNQNGNREKERNTEIESERESTKRETQLSNIDTSEVSSLFRHSSAESFFSFVSTCDRLYASDSRIVAICW